MTRFVWIMLGLMIGVTAQAASFDCEKASTKVEHMICDDLEISKLDNELNSAYKAAVQDKQHANKVKQAQKQWMKERNGCADAACVKGAYEARLASLKVTRTFSDTGAANKQNAGGDSLDGQQYRFQLTKGAGTPVCDAYLERLNTTKYEEPPYCGRPENDAIKGFAKLNRVPLSAAGVHDLYPIIWTFMKTANQRNLDWTDMNLQQRLTQKGQFRLTAEGTKLLQMDLDKGWAGMWRYTPDIDIDNDGTPDVIEIWNGISLPTGVGGRLCGESMTDIRPGLTSLRQPQIAFVITGSNDRLDVAKTRKIFEHPAREYHLASGNISSDFRPIGNSLGIFKYQDMYYFDTFFDDWGDFENKRKNDKDTMNSLAVFLHKDGKTSQVCEYLMLENEIK